MTDERQTTRRRSVLRAGAIAAAVSTAGCTVEIAGYEIGFGGDHESGSSTSTQGDGDTGTATSSSTESQPDTSTGASESDDVYGDRGYGEYGYGGVAP